MSELLKQIDTAYQGIQQLRIEPTKNNVAIILNVLNAFEKAYEYIQTHGEEKKNEVADSE